MSEVEIHRLGAAMVDAVGQDPKAVPLLNRQLSTTAHTSVSSYRGTQAAVASMSLTLLCTTHIHGIGTGIETIVVSENVIVTGTEIVIGTTVAETTTARGTATIVTTGTTGTVTDTTSESGTGTEIGVTETVTGIVIETTTVTGSLTGTTTEGQTPSQETRVVIVKEKVTRVRPSNTPRLPRLIRLPTVRVSVKCITSAPVTPLVASIVTDVAGTLPTSLDIHSAVIVDIRAMSPQSARQPKHLD